MKNSMIASLAVLALLAVASAKELPSFLQICPRTSESCIIQSVESLKPYLMKGVPEYNIPSLEPLVLKDLIAAQGGQLRVTAKDIHVYGASDFTVTNLKLDWDNMRLSLDVSLPNIYVQGLYDVEGKILLLPIRGSGPMSGNFTNCMGMVTIDLQVEKDSNGEDHIKITEFKMRISVGKGSMKLENLFGGEEVLGDVVNNAINSNFDAFLRELQPIVEQGLSDAFLEIANNIVEQFTFEQLFPES